jgi:hypothetical protein
LVSGDFIFVDPRSVRAPAIADKTLTHSDLSTIVDSTFRGYRAALVRQIVLRAGWSLRH